jgi:hypothetical protein
MKRRWALGTGLCVVLSAGFASGQQEAALTLKWAPNTEPDLAGYRVYYGTRSGRHRYCVDAGKETEFRLEGLEAGVRYYFVVTAYDLRGNESAPSEEVSWVAGSRELVPDALTLLASYPNPFRSAVTLELVVPQRSNVTVEVLDLRGRVVRHLKAGEMPAGRHRLQWDGKADDAVPLPAGIYLVSLKADGRMASRAVTWLGP